VTDPIEIKSSNPLKDYSIQRELDQKNFFLVKHIKSGKLFTLRSIENFNASQR